ncbi:MAG: peptide-N-glycosidase F-related protein [Planctomycetota bacterium]
MEYSAVLGLALITAAGATTAGATEIDLFSNSRIGFGGGQQREVQTTITFPEFDSTDKLVLNWGVVGDEDPWDRAGSIHVQVATGEWVQLGKFITGFNGTTTHSQDISRLAPLLSGQTLAVEAHIDTWVRDGWRLDASIDVTPERGYQAPTWAEPVIGRTTSYGRGISGDVTRGYNFTVPWDMEQVTLTYFASGHHNSQTNNSDEFNRRRHTLLVNGEQVWSGIPWRTDGPNFRSVNPTSGRWDGNGDGDTNDPYPVDVWSSDYPRSGWVPGDDVAPYEFDITEFVDGPGPQSVVLTIEDIDINSFWRVSAFVSGTPTFEPAVVGDLNGDSVVDTNDWRMFRASMFADLSGLTGQDLYEAGDLNGDGENNEVDLRIFREAFESSQGVALFSSAAASAPEPSSASLVLAATLGGIGRGRRRA